MAAIEAVGGEMTGNTQRIHRKDGVSHRLYTVHAQLTQSLSPKAGPKRVPARITVWKKNVERVLEEKVGKYVILCVRKANNP